MCYHAVHTSKHPNKRKTMTCLYNSFKPVPLNKSRAMGPSETAGKQQGITNNKQNNRKLRELEKNLPENRPPIFIGASSAQLEIVI